MGLENWILGENAEVRVKLSAGPLFLTRPIEQHSRFVVSVRLPPRKLITPKEIKGNVQPSHSHQQSRFLMKFGWFAAEIHTSAYSISFHAIASTVLENDVQGKWIVGGLFQELRRNRDCILVAVASNRRVDFSRSFQLLKVIPTPRANLGSVQ
jgi:hypothetical protein